MEYNVTDPLENMKSPEYENYYDNKFHMFEELKIEVPGTEVFHSDCNVNNEIASKGLTKFKDQNEIKHEAMANELPLNVTIKTERTEEGEILENNEDMSVTYKLTVQEVQVNSDERLLKNNGNLFKSNNEQKSTPRVVKLKKLHKCKHCNVYFDHPDNMLIHISLVHNEKTSKCELSGKQLNNVPNLKRHIILLHKHKDPPKVIFKCINCKAEFNNRLTLTDHAKICLKEGKIIAYKCHSCDGVYKSEQNLRTHMKRKHFVSATTLECLCGKRYRSLKQLSGHRKRCRVNTNKEEHKCECCGAVFKLKSNLTKHMKSIHYDYGRTFDCSCGKQFRSPVHLRNHKRRQHERKIKDTDNDRFQCDSCQKFLTKKDSLVKHIKRFHYDYGRTFGCWCGKQFRSPVQLRYHKWGHHERKTKYKDNVRFQCDNCQKFFTKKDSLVIHMKSFHYEYGKTFDCWCGKKYRSPIQLKAHMRSMHQVIVDRFCATGNVYAKLHDYQFSN